MLDVLFQIIIYPIYAVLEVLFHFIYKQVYSDMPLTILLISLIVSLFCLPLYLNADRLQKEEEKIQKKLSKRVKSIKNNFEGDEKYLLLQTYYRQNNYHPVMALRLSFSLLLQIPFFIAAYLFFHNLPELSGYSSGLIEDLSKPDRILKIGSISINILPILMTVVNLLAGRVYAKDKSFRENLQLYITALLFLVLLYNSPAGLVLYWLYNNVFSLVKNIGLTCWKPEKFVKYTFYALLCTFYLYCRKYHLNMDVILVILVLLLIKKECVFNYKIPQLSDRLFTGIMLSLWLLYGCLLPSNVVITSPIEFALPSLNITPLSVLAYPMFQAFGLFMFWGHCFYFLAKSQIKMVLTFGALFLLVASILNMLAVPMPVVDLNAGMQFNTGSISFRTLTDGINMVLCLVPFVLIAALLYLYCKYKKVFNAVILLNLITIFSVSGIQYIKILNCYLNNQQEKDKIAMLDSKFFKLSADKKNVLIIFLDKAISSFFPVILEERAELKDAFSGFVYYPNTASFAGYTVIGYQPIMGGYEYTPIHLQERANIFEQEFNRAVSVLPRIFKQADWNVTVADVPSGDAVDFIDADSYYRKFGINYVKTHGNLGQYLNSDVDVNTANLMLTRRNLFYFSILWASPMLLRDKIYDKGRYFSASKLEYKPSRAAENYAELSLLPKLTTFTTGENHFTVINNALPHDQMFLELPDYTYSTTIDSSDYDILSPDVKYMTAHYHVNAASLILLGKYLNFLKENGVYDNTRIIVVADHGRGIKSPYVDKKLYDFVLAYNPLLLVKDFNSNGKLRTDKTFMTNADVPLLATEGLIENPVNPYTNQVLNCKDKLSGIYVKGDDNWRESHYLGGNKFIFDSDPLYFVRDNVFDLRNWRSSMKLVDVMGKRSHK